MLWLLVRHEWRVMTANAIARLVFVVFGVALVAATALGLVRVLDAGRISRDFEYRGGIARVHAETAPRADLVANERGALVHFPLGPLGSFSIGQSDVYPHYVRATARSLDGLVPVDPIEHPLSVASGQFDVAFVMLFLYPLLIFAISFDLTAGERDRGTLRMVLSQPVTLRQVVAGKMLVRALVLLVPALVLPEIAMIATGLILSPPSSDLTILMVHPRRVDNFVWGRLGLWTLGVAAYAAIWHGIALLVNARGLNAATNALVLAGIWLMFVVVGPSAVNLLIATRYPMPSRVEAAVQARAATQEATVQGSRELGQFLQDHPTSGSVGRDGMRQFALLQAQRDQRVADRLQSVEATFNEQLQKQQRLAGWLSVVSPTMVAQGVLLDAAGTGTHRYEHFRAQALDFQRQWRAYFEPRVLDAATLTQAENDSKPAFTYRPEPLPPVRARVQWPIAMMLGVALLLWWAGFRQYKGYQV